MRLILEQHIVHGPEFSLRRGGLRDLRRHHGVRVSVLQRKMPEYEANLVGISLQQKFRSGCRNFAARALEVAVFNQGNTRVF
jgi:hypothetical protein